MWGGQFMKTNLASWSKGIVCASFALTACGGPSGSSGPNVEPVAEAEGAVKADQVDTPARIANVELSAAAAIGREVGVAEHLRDGDEYRRSVSQLIRHGRTLFEAVFTPQEGAGRPLSKGTGSPVSDPSSPLIFPRAFNRLSAMDANSCGSCHGVPFL